jgi:uncharacterized protein DUF4105
MTWTSLFERIFRRPIARLSIGLLVCALSGCLSAYAPVKPISQLPDDNFVSPLMTKFSPSHDRDWAPEQAVLPEVQLVSHEVRLKNIRQCDYRTADDFTVSYHDKTYSLSDVKTVDVIVVPFAESPEMAHMMMSFGFDGGEYLGVSVEARREKSESYDPIKGMLRQYELIYVVAEESDLIQLRTNHWLDEVYLYRLNLTASESQEIFLDVMGRVDALADQPEFYHTISNNCSLNLFEHLKKVRPETIRLDDIRVLLAGGADRMLYDAGLLRSEETFERTKDAARVNYAAYRWRDNPQFSSLIRVRR